MYSVVEDPYCYPGSKILKNKKKLQDPVQLERFEIAVTTQRSDEPLPNGRLTVTHYRAIHHHLFQDIYDWAGRYRTVRISKNGNMFCYPENIETSMRSLFKDLANANFFRNLDADTFSKKTAHFLSDLNAIHPFREGNGRAQFLFVSLLAYEADWPFEINRLNPTNFFSAMIESFSGSEDSLKNQIKGLIKVISDGNLIE